MTHEKLIAELEKIELAEYIHLEHVVAIKKAAAALREADAEITRKDRQLEKSELEYQKLHNEIERLKGKVVSPDVTTMCYCEDCGAATRWGRHLDVDCKTIQDLSKFKASMTTAIAQAVSDALAQADEQHKVDVAELQAKLAIVDKFMATDYEDSGVTMFQAELTAAIKELK